MYQTFKNLITEYDAKHYPMNGKKNNLENVQTASQQQIIISEEDQEQLQTSKLRYGIEI